jgi:glycosyltransferase involved in cell wall biosynthesis
VHDYLLVMRGAERTFAAMAACWPGASIHTLLYDELGTRRAFSERLVKTSYLQRFGAGQSNFRRLLPLFPGAARRLDVSGCRLVVSSSSAFAHGVRAAPGAVHVSYCHSPFRYAWHERDRALSESPRLMRPVTGALLSRIRRWDVEASRHVTHYIANSRITQRRIEQFYGRESRIVHPPVEVERFHLAEPGDYFLVVSEIVRHKRVDLALEAARLAGQPLKVVGTGPELKALTARYGDSAEFLGRVKDSELTALLAGARASIVPNVEEFGIAAVEAQAAGRPVVALAHGGTAETIVDGETGVLVDSQDPKVFADALSSVDFDRFSSTRIRRHAAENFSTAAFMRRLKAEVERLVGD